MKIDHIVVHIDEPQTLEQVRIEAKRSGFSIDSVSGRGGKGLATSNVWFGSSDFGLAKFVRPTNLPFVPVWAEMKQQTEHGRFCLFLRVPSVEKLQYELALRGVRSSIERTEAKTLFGISWGVIPWQYLRLPTLPGTSLEIAFIEAEESALRKAHDQIKQDRAEISEVDILLPRISEALPVLHSIFPNLEIIDAASAKVSLEQGTLHFSQSGDGKFQVVVDTVPLGDSTGERTLLLSGITVCSGRLPS